MRQLVWKVLAVGIYGSLFLAAAGMVRCQDPVLINHVAASSTTTGTVSTAAINTTGANTLLVCYGASTAGNVASPISDTIGGSPSGNTWTQIKRLPFAADTQGSIWAAFGANVGANHVFTAAGYAPALAVGAFAGISGGPDGTPVSSEGSSSPVSLGTLVPTYNNELLWDCMTGHNGSGGALAASSPLTTLDQIPSSTLQGFAILSGYEIQGTATSTAVANTYAGTLNYVVALAVPFFSIANPKPLAVTTTTLPEGFNGIAYGPGQGPGTNQLQAQFGTAPYSWSLTSGSLTACGLSVNSAGLITGTATTSTCSGLVFTVTDSTSPPFTATFPAMGTTSIGISASPLSLPTTTCPSGVQYASYAGCNFFWIRWQRVTGLCLQHTRRLSMGSQKDWCSIPAPELSRVRPLVPKASTGFSSASRIP